MPELVGDDVELGRVTSRGAQLFEELTDVGVIDVDGGVPGTVERPHLGLPHPAGGADGAGEQFHRGVFVVRRRLRPVVLDDLLVEQPSALAVGVDVDALLFAVFEVAALRRRPGVLPRTGAKQIGDVDAQTRTDEHDQQHQHQPADATAQGHPPAAPAARGPLGVRTGKVHAVAVVHVQPPPDRFSLSGPAPVRGRTRTGNTTSAHRTAGLIAQKPDVIHHRGGFCPPVQTGGRIRRANRMPKCV